MRFCNSECSVVGGPKMSAWVVSKAHIDALVTAALADGLSWWQRHDCDVNVGSNSRRWIDSGDLDRAHEVGMMLWAENVASIHCRYPDTAENDADYPGPSDFSEADVASYRYRPTTLLGPVEILKAIACYAYQACEHDGWNTSEARSFCESLRDDEISRLDGYDDAPWGLDDDDVGYLDTGALRS